MNDAFIGTYSNECCPILFFLPWNHIQGFFFCYYFKTVTV